MKVLFTLDSCNRGGAEILVLDICRNAAAYGIELMLAASGGGDLEGEFQALDIPSLRLKRKFPLDMNLIRRLRQLIRENEIEIVHCHQPIEALHVYLATFGLKVKRVLTHHGGGTGISTGKNRYVAKLLTPRMDGNIACSRGMLPWLRSEVGLDTSKNFHMIHNGVDAARLECEGGLFKRELGLGFEDQLLGMVANFVPSDTKDQMTVCRALPEVFNRSKNAYFVFVGNVSEGSEGYFEECVTFCDESGIGDRVFFVGRRNDVPEILHDLDLFVFSTLNEGLPISLIEAMLSGVAVLATDIEPVLETTNNGKCIATFSPKNYKELSAKIVELLSDTDLRKRLAGKAKAHAMEHFSIGAHLRSLKELYRELL